MNRRSFASIYALILAGTYKYTPLDDNQIQNAYETGDIDMTALWCILSAGWFVVVPLLSWSSTLRRLRARPIFMYWTFLIAVGGTCAGITLRGGHPFKVYWATAAAICTSKPDYHQNPTELYLSSWSAWSSNNCTSQCGSLEPTLLLRTGTQMVPIIQTELPNIFLPIINAKKFFGPLTGYVSPVVFIQWIYACWSGRRTPSEARDWICVKLCKRRSSFQQMRSMLAVSIALCVYAFACASFTICPFLFMFNIIFNEMNMVYLPPDAEPLTAVGQWSQCVITILLVLAAIINKYHSSWSRNANKSWKIVMKTLFIRRKELSSDRSDLEWSGSRKVLSSQLTVERLGQPEPLASCEPLVRRTIFQRLTDPLRKACVHVRQEWWDFYLWIQKPIEISRSNTALRQIVAARVESHGRFQVPPLERTSSVSLVHLADLQIKPTNLPSRQRSRSL